MPETRRYCLALDLKDDNQLIAEYEAYHRRVWPEIVRSIKEAGISDMEIYRFSTRLFMIIEAERDFSFERKASLDAANENVIRWEELMWRYQQSIPGAKPGEKWVLMNRIFKLKEQI